MDRRNWLWRRRSSEKSPSGETDSSESLSSHSERFSDDQIITSQQKPYPEVTSTSPSRDELRESVKALSEKLSEALLNIQAKEELVKQHSKVAEEAVSGWERAENEVSALKKLNDALKQKNLILDERVSHLDGALKECVKQLRQSREEQEEKISEAVSKINKVWETKKLELETQLSQLHSQLANEKADAIDSSLLADACSKLEEENSMLKLQLLSKDRELELRTNEWDLSTRAAEYASKNHLESTKKVSKLEAECRKLRAMIRKSDVVNHQTVSESSLCAESLTDSLSDCGERILCVENELSQQLNDGRAIGKSNMNPCVEIDLMDDFLEMEKLAAVPPSETQTAEQVLQSKLESAIKQTGDIEESLKAVTGEKVSLEIALEKCQMQLTASNDQIMQANERLVDLEKQLAMAIEEKGNLSKELCASIVKIENLTGLLDEAERKIVGLHDELTEANAAKNTVDMQLEDANKKRAEAKSHIQVLELELGTLKSSLSTLREEAEMERKNSKEAGAKCKILETELSKLKLDTDSQTSGLKEEIKAGLKKLEDANLKRIKLENEVNEMKIKLQTLQLNIYDLEQEVEQERQLSREAVAKCGRLEAEISRIQQEPVPHESAAEFQLNQEKELEVAARKFAECQKTIASLGHNLKSLASFEDLLINYEKPLAGL